MAYFECECDSYECKYTKKGALVRSRAEQNFVDLNEEYNILCQNYHSEDFSKQDDTLIAEQYSYQIL